MFLHYIYYVAFNWECTQKNEPVCNFFTNILLIFQIPNFFSDLPRSCFIKSSCHQRQVLFGYPIKEAKLVKVKEEYRDGLLSSDETVVVCKYYPECNGEAFDLIPVNEIDG